MRKRVGGIFTALVLGTTLGGCWMQPGFNAGRTNSNGAEQELRSDNVHLLTSAWEAATFGTKVNAPVSVGGVTYVTTYSGRVAAYDSATGAVRWERNFYEGGAAPVFGDPAWHGDELLVPGTFQGKGGVLRLDPADGSTIGGGLDGEATGPVAVSGGQIATMAGTVDPSGFGTAHIDWKFRSAVPLGPGMMAGSAFAVVGERVMWSLGTKAQGFSAVCPAYPAGFPVTGCAPDWSVELGGRPTTPAAVAPSGVVYADDSGTVTVLDAATGSVRWTGEVGASVVQAPAVAGDTILVATSDLRLVAFAATGCGAGTCPPLWEGTLQDNAITAPMVAGDVVYVGTTRRRIAAFDLAGCEAGTCSPLATISWVWPGNVTGGPIVDDGMLIAGTDDGRIVAFRLPDPT
jgi:outer membrane protein assembly factor BamB